MKKNPILYLFPLLLLAFSCIRQECGSPDIPLADAGGRVRMPVSIEGMTEDGISVKAPFLEGSESVNSGTCAFVYYSDNGMLDSVQQIGSDGTVSLPNLREVDIYVLGNFWAKDASTGARISLGDAYGADFPIKSEELEQMVLRLDGSAINSSARWQTLSDVKSFGVPFAGEKKAFVAGKSGSLSVECKRLFSKLRLTIDHSGLDPETGSNLVRNVKLNVRQSNARLQPFGAKQSKALSAADIIEGDCDPAMTNGKLLTYEFYMPENMQGELLPGNTDQSLKSEEQIVAAHGSAKAGLLSYVEFVATIDPSGGGYGGTVAYRFYLGKDALSNCDLERGRRYDVSLGFKVSSLFDPYWQVQPDFEDNRSIGISADAAFAKPLPEGQMVAVRKSRPGSFYVYIGKNGSKSVPAGLRDAGYEPSGVSENSITGDFLSQSNDAAEVPKLAQLSALGITPSYDAATGRLSFTVTDPSKFKVGEEIELNLATVPKGKTCSFRIRTYEDLSISWKKSSRLYLGMSNTLVMTGYSGELAFKANCGMYKFTKDLDKTSDFVPFREYLPDYCKSSGPEFTIYRLYDEDVVGGNPIIYALPLDSFNDGGEVKKEVSTGHIRVSPLNGMDVYLDMRGTPLEFSFYLKDRYTSEVIPRGDFEDFMFDYIFGPDNSRLSSSEECLFGGAGGDYVAVSATDKKDEYGYTVYNLYRCRIGSDFRHVGGQLANGPINLNFHYGNNGWTHITSSGTEHVEQDRNVYSHSIWFMTFMKDPKNVVFAERYDDYGLCLPDNLDADKVSCIESNPEYVNLGEDFEFYLDGDACEIVAKPLASSSMTDSDGASRSMKLTHEQEGNRLAVYFTDDGSTTFHNAGPHSICARVTNIHSGETLDVEMGRTDVYVHFAVGLDYDSESIKSGSSLTEVKVWPAIYSDISRSSFGTPSLNSSFSDSFELEVADVYDEDTDTQPFYLPKTGGVDIGTVKRTMPAFRRIGARTKPVQGRYIQTFEITPASGAEAAANLYSFAENLKQEGNMAHTTLAYQLGRTFVKMQFANPAYWKDALSSAAKYIDSYDRTAFGDLYVNPDAVRGDADYRKGYFVFDRLGDLRSSSYDWIPCFITLSRL